jgi:cysteine desulfuration protein SufE
MLDFKEMFADLVELDDAMDKYEWIIEYGADRAGLAEDFCTDESLVKGCTSNLWLDQIDNRLWAYGESSIVHGLACMITDWFNQASADQRRQLSLNTLSHTGLTPLLSMGRQNGMANLIAKIKTYE